MSALEDRFAIVDALNLLSRLFDARAWDRIGEVMAPDVVAYDCHGLDSVITDSLRAHLGGCGPSQHLLGNHEVVVDGDRATSSSHLQLVITGSKGAHILFTGLYEDELRRVDGAWLFVRRKLHQDMPVAAKTAA